MANFQRNIVENCENRDIPNPLQELILRPCVDFCCQTVATNIIAGTCYYDGCSFKLH